MLRLTAPVDYNSDMDANQPYRPRWFQVSLRTLLLVMLVCGPVGGWIAQRIEKNQFDRNAEQGFEAITTVGGVVVKERSCGGFAERTTETTYSEFNHPIDED